PDRRVDVVPVVRALGIFVADERAALGVTERAERVVGHGDADRLAMRGGRIVLDRRVEPVAPVLLMYLACPGVLLHPSEIRGLHDLAMRSPRAHILSRIG